MKYTADGLKPNKTYYFRVFAVNEAGTGPSSIKPIYAFAATASAVAPSYAINLAATADGTSKIQLTWTAPTDDGGAKIARYCIEAIANAPVAGAAFNGWPGVDDVSAGARIDETDVCNVGDAFTDGFKTTSTGGEEYSHGGVIVVTGTKIAYDHTMGVAAGQTWKYRAYAVNADKVRSRVASNIARATTPSATKPGKPENLRVVRMDADGNSGNMFDLYWNWPKQPGKEEAQTGLTFTYASRLYHIHDHDGDGATDPELAWDGWEDQSDPPVINDGVAVSDLQVTQASVAGFGLAGEKVQFRVRSHKADLDGNTEIATDGSESSAWTTTAAIGYLAMEPTLPGSPTEAEATDAEDLHTINLTWTRASTSHNSVIDASFDEGKTWVSVQGSTSYTLGSWDHLDLDPGTDVMYRIFPWRDDKYGVPATADGSTKDATEPARVEGLTVTANGTKELVLNWTRVDPADNGGEIITGYRVEIGSDEDNDSTDNNIDALWDEVDPIAGGDVIHTDANTTTYAKGKLSPGDRRWFRVIAINDVNKVIGSDAYMSSQNSAIRKSGITDLAGTPGMPVGVVAETARDSSGKEATQLGVNILWDAPESGDSATGYIIDRQVKMGTGAWSAWTELKAYDNKRTSHTDREQPVTDEQRAYRVRAKSGSGTGMWSATAYYPHEASPHGATSPSGLTAPSGVVVSTLANTQSVSVVWDTTSIRNAEQIKVVLYNSAVTALAQPLKTINPANDVGSHTFSDVPDGTYYVTVASFRTGERHMLSPIQLVTVE